MIHSLDTNVAEDVGVIPALIFNSVGYWVNDHVVRGTNLHDGRHWVYNSVSEWMKFFPYLTKSQIERALQKLRDGGYLETGDYNKDRRVRTLWYTLTDKGVAAYYREIPPSSAGCISHQCEMHSSSVRNDSISIPLENTLETNYCGQTAKPTDSDSHDTMRQKNSDRGKYDDIVVAVIEYLNKKTGSKRRPMAKENVSLITALLKDGYTLEDFKKVIDTKCADWLGDREMSKYLRPSTLFAKKHFDDYLNQPASRPAHRQGRVTSGDNTDFRAYG